MIYEQRVYTCLPGRLAALNKRFENVTLKLFEQHGFRPVGFWTTLVGEDNNQLTYILAWENMAERERKWAGFMSDPNWLKARSESERDGLIVARIQNQFFTPTAYSALK